MASPRTRLMTRAMGLGDASPSWGDIPVIWPDLSPGGTVPVSAPSGDRPGWWDIWGGPLLAGAERTISNIFAPAATSIAQAQPQIYSGYQQQVPRDYRYQSAPQGVGFGIDGQGIRLSDGSHISWVIIAIAGGAFMLLQARPLSRR